MSYSPGGPGVAPGGPAEPAFSQAGLQDVVNSWIAAITKPNVQTFAAEVPRIRKPLDHECWLGDGHRGGVGLDRRPVLG